MGRTTRRPAGLLAGLLACACLWIGAAQLAAAQATAAGCMIRVSSMKSSSGQGMTKLSLIWRNEPNGSPEE